VCLCISSHAEPAAWCQELPPSVGGRRTLIIEIEPACKERIAQNYAMRVGVCASAWGWRHVRQAACRRATWIWHMEMTHVRQAACRRATRRWANTD